MLSQVSLGPCCSCYQLRGCRFLASRKFHTLMITHRFRISHIPTHAIFYMYFVDLRSRHLDFFDNFKICRLTLARQVSLHRLMVVKKWRRQWQKVNRGQNSFGTEDIVTSRSHGPSPFISRSWLSDNITHQHQRQLVRGSKHRGRFERDLQSPARALRVRRAFGRPNTDVRSRWHSPRMKTLKVARNEVENASFAQRSAHRDSRIWRPELIEPAAERKPRARGRRPTFKSAYPDPQILPQCNISSNYPL